MRAAQIRRFATKVQATDKISVSCPNQLLINGNWVDAISKKTFETCDPATGKLITHVSSADKADVDEAVKAASDALNGPWKKVSGAQRGVLMNRFADEILKAKDELIHLQSTDNGKAAF